MKELTIHNSDLKALVDDEDYQYLSQYKWYVYEGVNKIVSRYAYIKGAFRYRSLAQETMRKYATMFDHIDRDYLNNQKSNLRICTQSQNRMNSTKQKATSSRFKGVTKRSDSGKWRAKIGINLKEIRLGTFESEIDAGIAYNMGAFKYFKEFANYNPLPTVFSI